MSDESGTERCGRCGAEFVASSSPLGLCPACLLKLGMSGVAMAPPPAPEPESVPPPVTAAPASAGRRLRLPSRSVWAAFALICLILAGAYFFLRLPPRAAIAPTHASAVRFTVTLPDEAELLEGSQFAVSPDGLNLVVAARGADRRSHLWLRRLQSLDWRRLAQTDGATLPFWSADSRHVGFFTDRTLKRLDISNGLTQTICDAAIGRGGTWSLGNVVVFAASGGLFRVPASGGVPSLLTNTETGPHLWPQFLADGHHIVVLTRERNTDSRHILFDTRSSASVVMADGRGRATVVGDTLLFSYGTTLGMQQIDPGRGTLVGEAKTIGGVEDLSSSADDGAAFSASSTVLVYRRGAPRLSQLTWINRAGEVIGTSGEPGEYEHVSVSPSGRSLAVIVRRDGRGDASSLWVFDANGQRVNRVTSGTSLDAFPLWSPDETHIAYRSTRGGRNDLYTVVADGGHSETVLLESPLPATPTDWLRDGRFLFYTVRSSTTGSDVWALQIGAGGKPEALLQSASNESHAVASPDGRWIAYVSDESGGDEVYVRTFPLSEGRWQISIDGGTRPQWGPDGRELFFVSDGRLSSVEIGSGQGSALRPSTPRSWFMMRGTGEYAVDRARRFLVLMPIGEAGVRQLEVVMNWASELRQPR